ncbi:hypothetical protein EDB89DRAFT_1849164, partial [Lactarius sanguifluus]
LLAHGYIAHAFRSRRARQFFLHLLKVKSIPQVEILSYPDREGHFFYFDPNTSVRGGQPFATSSWLLDRAVVNRGSVVPQTMWSPHTAIDRRHYVEQAVLQKPIFFEGVDGRLGLPLEAAAAGRCHGLRDAQEFAPLGETRTTQIRIAWPGYKHFMRQVQIRDETSGHDPITISRFAHHIGRSVDALLKWQIGLSGIQRSDIIVIGAVHVAAGSWMPILQLNRYIL